MTPTRTRVIIVGFALACAMAVLGIVWQPLMSPDASARVAGDASAAAAFVPAREDEGSAAVSSEAPPAAPLDRVDRTRGPSPRPAPWMLDGTVRDASGAALEGAVVALRSPLGGAADDARHDLASTRSAADGRYSLDLSYWRDRSPIERAVRPAAVIARRSGRRDRTAEIRLAAGVRDEPLVCHHDFVLEAVRTVTGRVVDSTIAPCAGWVSVATPADGRFLGRERAAADGRFGVEIGPDVRRIRVAASHATVGMATAEFDVGAASANDIGDLVLVRGYPLAGTVRLVDGTPLAGFEVKVSAQPDQVEKGGSYWYHHVVTDANGFFAAHRPTLSPWRVFIAHVPMAGRVEMDSPLELPADRDCIDLAIDGVWLRLTWLAPDGQQLLPVPARCVVFAPADLDLARAARAGDTDSLARALGVVDLSRPVVVPAGVQLWIRAEVPGGLGVDELVNVPARSCAFDLGLPLVESPAAAIDVRVRFDDGEIPAEFRCDVRPEPGARPREFVETSRSPGRVQGWCAVGNVRVIVSAYDGWRDAADEERLLVTRGDRDNDVEVVVRRRGRVQLVLRDSTDPHRVVADGIEGDVEIGGVACDRFFWRENGELQHYGFPPIGLPIEPRALFPIGRQPARFALAGFEPKTMTLDVRTGEPQPVVVWLQPE
ncbi:MAG: carboxypeptidase regulatory-like domain-containing protein [Planctomycetes bacterium]|nr:carboxypeptidase regulatory-like domain-containing protein [Planctomycetota bacterium]